MGLASGLSVVEEVESLFHNYKCYERGDEELNSYLEMTLNRLELFQKQGNPAKKRLEESLEKCQIENDALHMKLKAARKLCDEQQNIVKTLERYTDSTKYKVEQCIKLLDGGKVEETQRNLVYILKSFPGISSTSDDEDSFINDPSVTLGSILTVSELELTIEEEEEHPKPIRSAALDLIRRSVRSIRSSFSIKRSQKRKSTSNLNSSKYKIAKVDQKDDVSTSQLNADTNSYALVESQDDNEEDLEILDIDVSLVFSGKNVPFNSSFRSPDKAPDFCINEDDNDVTSPPIVPEVCRKACGLKSLPAIPDTDRRRDGLTDRLHQFVSARAPVFRGPVCTQCDKKIVYSKDKEMFSCRDCKAVCHSGCRRMVLKPCIPIVKPPDKLKSYKISDFAPRTEPMIPSLIYHCANEIENKGLNVVGIYRVSGLHAEIETIRDQFMRGECLPRLDKIDVHSLSGAIKSFLIKLKEPLIPISKWKDFIMATYEKDPEDALPHLFQALYDLPQPNRDTLAYLVSHLQRISECESVKMPVDNLATVWAPTLVGYSVPNASDFESMMQETALQKRVVELLMNVPNDYWRAILNPHQTFRRQDPQQTSSRSEGHNKTRSSGHNRTRN